MVLISHRYIQYSKIVQGLIFQSLKYVNTEKPLLTNKFHSHYYKARELWYNTLFIELNVVLKILL